MTNPLLERLKKNSTVKETALISESSVYNDRESIPTDIPIINLALSGRFDGGIECGLTGLAAPSKHFKTNIMLKCVSVYMNKHQDAVCLFYDSEFGSPAKYFESFDIDVERVIHTPITTVEELRSDITNQLEAINTNDKVIIIIDSIGNLASRKETEDALEQKEKSDMTRAKTLKSLFRIITPKLNLKKVPCIYINHTIEEIGMFSKTVMTGGCVVEDTEIQTPNGLKKIQDFKIGDEVITKQGVQKVKETWTPETLEDGNPICYEIEFDDGYKVICSETHKFIVDGKWVEAKDLKNNDICETI